MAKKNGGSGGISIVILTEGFIPESKNNNFPGHAFRKNMIILSKDREFSNKETLDIARKFCEEHKKNNDTKIHFDTKRVNKEIKAVLRAA